MKKLSEFLAEFMFDEGAYSIDEKGEALKQFTSNIKLGIENYKQHLISDFPKTVQWAMIEKQLIKALEHMEFPDKRESCDHHLVERLDGYEGQCGPAICDKCGKYGCYCDAKYSKMTDVEKKYFHEDGINGSEHKLEKLIKIRNDTTGDVKRRISNHCDILISCDDCSLHPTCEPNKYNYKQSRKNADRDCQQ